MTTPNPPDALRASVSPSRNGTQVSLLSGGTAFLALQLAPYINQWRGLDYDQAMYIAVAAVSGGAYIAGVIGSVARDELHRDDSALVRMGPWRRMALTILSGLG